MGGFYDAASTDAGMGRIAVGAGLLVALLAVAVVGVGGVAAQDAGGNDTAASNVSLGAEISSFMQASSAEAEGEVDDGMFDAELNRTDSKAEKRALIEERQQRLRERQNRLAERRSAMSDDDTTSPGASSGVRKRALAARVNVGAAELTQSVNGTERAARAAGLETATLAEIRKNASELRGPEVADLARGIAGRTPALGNGPLETVPGMSRGENRSSSPEGGSGTDSDGGSDGGPEEDRDEVPSPADARESNRSQSSDAVASDEDDDADL